MEGGGGRGLWRVDLRVELSVLFARTGAAHGTATAAHTRGGGAPGAPTAHARHIQREGHAPPTVR